MQVHQSFLVSLLFLQGIADVSLEFKTPQPIVSLVEWAVMRLKLVSDCGCAHPESADLVLRV